MGIALAAGAADVNANIKGVPKKRSQVTDQVVVDRKPAEIVGARENSCRWEANGVGTIRLAEQTRTVRCLLNGR
jgi:hypothetical protein